MNTAEKHPQTKRLMRWKTLRAVLVLLFSGVVMVFLFGEISDSPQSLDAIATAKVSQLWAAIAWMILAFFISVLKWRELVQGIGHPIKLSRATYAMLVSWPFATVTPSRAGDLLRTWIVAKDLPLLRGHATVVFDRLLDIQSLVLLATAGTLWLGASWLWLGLFLVLGIVIVWLLGILLVRRHRTIVHRIVPSRMFRDYLNGILATIGELLRRPRVLVWAGTLSLATWICVQLMFYSLCQAFGLRLAVVDALAVWPLATLVGLAPITLSGMGTRDIAFIAMIQLLHPLVDSEEMILLATVGYTMVSAWLFAIIGAPWAIWWILRGSNAKQGESKASLMSET